MPVSKFGHEAAHRLVSLARDRTGEWIDIDLTFATKIDQPRGVRLIRDRHPRRLCVRPNLAKLVDDLLRRKFRRAVFDNDLPSIAFAELDDLSFESEQSAGDAHDKDDHSGRGPGD